MTDPACAQWVYEGIVLFSAGGLLLGFIGGAIANAWYVRRKP